MEKKKNLINLIFSPKLLIIEWSIIIVFCIFIGFSIRGKCASSIKKLPYDYSWNYIALDENQIDVILNQASKYIDTSSDNVIIFFYEPSPYNSYPVVCVAVVDSVTYSNNATYENADLLMDSLSFHFSSSTISFYSSDLLSVIDNGNQAYAPTGYSFFGSNATYMQVSFAPYEIYRNMPLYGTVELDGKLIIGTPEVAPNGHATPPDLTGNNIGSDKPDIDDYLPNIPSMPSLDNSSLEKIGESIYNILQWGFNVIKGTLNGLFEYLADTFNYSIQKVIDNIKNAIQNFYDNMKSLFEPLLNGLAEIGQAIKETIETIKLLLEAFFAPFDEDQFQEAYENCDFINAVDGVNDSIEEFEHAFTYAEERDYYTLYLGFIMDGYTVNYDLDFTWLYPLRQYYRPIIWAVVIYEFFVYLCSQLSDYLQGRSGK